MTVPVLTHVAVSCVVLVLDLVVARECDVVVVFEDVVGVAPEAVVVVVVGSVDATP